MAIILSTTETAELNQLLQEKNIPCALRLTDGCGWQVFRLKNTGPAPATDQDLNQLRAVVYNYLSAKNPDEPFDVHFLAGRQELYIR